ncbi:uncharacterized protein CTRU02_205336 [Colletotrichum truncatum]|uniref:Uncharacterized protein n=1 Tax=Colletotrichum truncatum TaxID=5467 RepID=A0ACC3Z3R5_COLTU
MAGFDVNPLKFLPPGTPSDVYVQATTLDLNVDPSTLAAISGMAYTTTRSLKH